MLQNGGRTGVNKIAVVRLRHRLTKGEIVNTITSPLFETATTLAQWCNPRRCQGAQFASAPSIPKARWCSSGCDVPGIVLQRRTLFDTYAGMMSLLADTHRPQGLM